MCRRTRWRGNILRSVILPVGLLTSAAVVILCCGGCATTLSPVVDAPAEWHYTAKADSLGLDGFLGLSRSDREFRRAHSQDYRVRAAQAHSLDLRIRNLINAAGLVPDDPYPWLQLAEMGRWVGDYVQTVQWLDNAATAVRHLGQKSDDPEDAAHWDAARLTGMAYGWLSYDRADWRGGLSWVNTLHRRSPGDEKIARLRGLLAGGAARRPIAERMADYIGRQDGYDADVPWILATLDRALGRPKEALNRILDMRPKPDRAAEAHRAIGELAELLGEYSHAERHYRMSYHSLPFDDESAVRKIRWPRLGNPRFREPVEFWVAFDRYYVTGSLSSYTAWAWDRYQAAENAKDRVFWAGQTVNGAGILIRKEMDRPWAQRIRGIVFLETEELEKALTDLNSASRRLRAAELPDQRVEASLGRVLLLKERHLAAREHLQLAVDLGPTDAAAWADLGLALVMTEDPHGAERALNRSIELNPASPTAWYNRGLLQMRAGDFQRAEEDLSEAARLAPDHPGVVKLLQKAHRLQKKRTGKETR